MTITDVLNEIQNKVSNKEYESLDGLLKILKEYFDDIMYECDYKIPLHIKNKIK